VTNVFGVAVETLGPALPPQRDPLNYQFSKYLGYGVQWHRNRHQTVHTFSHMGYLTMPHDYQQRWSAVYFPGEQREWELPGDEETRQAIHHLCGESRCRAVTMTLEGLESTLLRATVYRSPHPLVSLDTLLHGALGLLLISYPVQPWTDWCPVFGMGHHLELILKRPVAEITAYAEHARRFREAELALHALGDGDAS
jgi:hypothetical protein